MKKLFQKTASVKFTLYKWHSNTDGHNENSVKS